MVDPDAPVRVKVIDAALIATYGSYMHVPPDKAAAGVKKGIWAIAPAADRSGPLVSRDMVAGDGFAYLTKEGFEG